jgi:signal transduction histidine kinase
MESSRAEIESRGRLELSAVIERRRAEISARWLARVQASLPDGVNPTDLQRDIEEYIGALADALRGGERIAIEAEHAWGGFTRKHALTTIRLGFDVRQLVREFIELRRTLFEVLQEEGTHWGPDQADRVADLIEVAILMTIANYTKARDYEARKQQAAHIGFLTHELRNPLLVALLAVGYLKQVIPAEHQTHLDRLEHNLLQMRELINRVVLNERLDSTDVVSQPAVLQLADVLAAALPLIRDEAQRKGLDLRVEVSPALRVYADPALTLAILQNLVGNAVKYTDEGGVSVEAEERTSEVAVHVRDTCDGLSAEELSTIFDPFKRGHTRQPGTGLGLTITRRAVEVQGGEIQAESSLERGCHFWFTLPKPVS